MAANDNDFSFVNESQSESEVDCSFERNEEEEEDGSCCEDDAEIQNIETSLAYVGTIPKKNIKRSLRKPDDNIDGLNFNGKFFCSSCSKEILTCSIGTQTSEELNRQSSSTSNDEYKEISPIGTIRTTTDKSPQSSPLNGERQCLASPISQTENISQRKVLSLHSKSSSGSATGLVVNQEIRESFDTSRTILPDIGPPKIITYVGELPSPRLHEQEQDGDCYEKIDVDQMNLLCQFCGSDVRNSDEKLYCCAEFQAFRSSYTSYEQQQFDFIEDEMIDTAPHPPYGSKAARKAAKERAAERVREREMERQKGSAAHSNFYSFSRQMKTVQFSLSSAKCMTDGWTIRPVSPVIQTIKERGESFLIDFNASQLQQRGEMSEKFYESGQRFFVLFEDGTGSCYYPCGNLAVAITSTETGKFSYIVQENSSSIEYEGNGLLALFEANGYAACYYPDGTLRMCLNSYGGIELNPTGSRRKRWRWHHIKGHVHAPPFQSACITLNKQLSVRVSDQDNICLTFSCAKRTVRFNVGARLKALKLNKTNDFVLEEEESHLRETKKLISLIINKLQLTLRFPKSSTQEHTKPNKRSLKTLQNVPKDQHAAAAVFIN